MSKILFLDESGDHSLTGIDPQHPIFVLGGIIVDQDYAMGEMNDKLNSFKKDLFGTTNITLHTADFTRQKNGFERIMERDFCARFYEKLNQFISELDITILACVIKKDLHMKKYGIDALDPYHLSLNILIERFCFAIGHYDTKGNIIAEARDATLNRQLNLAWKNIQVAGTKFVKATEINKRIQDMNLKTKQSNLAGLEIADLIVTPIARHILGRQSRISIDLLKNKIWINKIGGDTVGHGLVILPK